MGEDLFGELVPQARPSALQAEYLLQHRDCPEPSDIVFSLARAFEIQVRDGWLKGFADYLLDKGIRDYPEVSDFKALLFRGKFQRERLTLEKMREVLDTDSCHLGEYGAKCGNERQKVRTALRSVIEFRNHAAHQGCPIADEEFGEAGKAVFALLDRKEIASCAATTQSPFGAMRGEFEVPEGWD
jgi:hypothetical protein